MQKKHISSLACLALAAALAGCAPLAAPSSASQTAEAPVYDSSALDDGILRFLFSTNSSGGGTLLRGGEVLYQAEPSEDVRLLTNPDTNLPSGWQKGYNGPEGDRCTDVYDTEGILLWTGTGEWRAALSDDLLALEPGPRRVDAGPDGEVGCLLMDLSSGEEIPLPPNTIGCIPTNEDQVVLTVTSNPEDPGMENSSVLIQTLEGEELLQVDNAYAFQAYGYQGQSSYICIQIYDPIANEWTTSFYNPISQEYIPRFYSFCGPDILCYQGMDGQYIVRALGDPAPLAIYDGSCMYWKDGTALVRTPEDDTIVYLPDGSALLLMDSLAYSTDEHGAAFLLADGSLLILEPDGSQVILTTELHDAAQATVCGMQDGCVLLSLESEDYRNIAYQIYDATGLLYDTSNAGKSYHWLLCDTSDEDGPLYQAAYTSLGGSTLYDILDCHGNVVLSGLANVYSSGTFDLPEGIFAAQRGFERGFMDSTGSWVYAESVFNSLSAEDGHYYW